MKYLVFALQGLGDTLEATPIVAALRAYDATAEIDVAVTRTAPAHVFRSMPELVSNVIELPYWEKGPAAFLRSLTARAWRVEYAASFMAYPAAKVAYHLVNACFRARRKFGHRYAERKVTNLLWSYTNLVEIRSVGNVERNLDLLAAAAIPLPLDVGYAIPERWRTKEECFRDLITVHVGSIAHDGLENKRWPLENFASLARRLQESGYKVALLAGPSELEATQRLLRDIPGARIVQGSLDETATHLARSAAVITNDSGIGHLAAAVGTAAITLFGPTPLSGAPFGPLSFPLRSSPCPPCFDPRDSKLYCKLDIDYRCLKRDLTVELVFDHVRAVLRRDSV